MKCSDDSFHATTRAAHDNASPCFRWHSFTGLNPSGALESLQQSRKQGIVVGLDAYIIYRLKQAVHR